MAITTENSDLAGWCSIYGSTMIGDGSFTYELRSRADTMFCVAWSPDGSATATARSEPCDVEMWPLYHPSPCGKLKGHLDHVRAIDWRGSQIASGSIDLTARVWDVATCKCTMQTTLQEGFVMGVALNNSLLALATYKSAVVWDQRAGGECMRLLGHTDLVTSVAWAARSDVIATSSHDRTAALWDPRTGQRSHVLQGHAGSVSAVVSMPDGQLATASDDTTVKLWDAGRCVHTFRGHETGVRFLSASAGGGKLASSSYDGMVKVWETDTGLCVNSTSKETMARPCAFSPLSNVLAILNHSFTSFCFWDMHGRENAGTLLLAGKRRRLRLPQELWRMIVYDYLL